MSQPVHPDQPVSPELGDPLAEQVFSLLTWRELICARLREAIVPNLPAPDRPRAEALAVRTASEQIVAPDCLSEFDAVIARVQAAIAAGRIPARQVEAADGSGPTWEQATRTKEAEALSKALQDLAAFRAGLKRLHTLRRARRIADDLRATG